MGGGFAATLGNWAPGWSVVPAKFNTDALTDSCTGFTTQATGGWWPGWQRFVIDLDGDGVSDLFLYDPVPTTGVWYQARNLSLGTFTYTTGTWNPNLIIVVRSPFL